METIKKRQPKKLPKILSREDVKKILAVPNVKTVTGLRNRVILQILYRAGLRVEEVCNLSFADINLKDGYIYIQQGKGKKDRYIPIDPETIDWLSKWESKRLPGDFLFSSHRGQKMDQSQIRKFVYLYSEKAGVFLQDGREKAKVHPHTFRACYATERLEEGLTIQDVRELMGHSSIQTTSIYTAIRPVQLREKIRSIPPIERVTA